MGVFMNVLVPIIYALMLFAVKNLNIHQTNFSVHGKEYKAAK
jgi:hypothetical protein